jgi:hypothetical protein
MLNNFRFLLGASTIAVVLTGCSAPVVKHGSYEGLKSLEQGKGTIYVYRESAFPGAMNQYDVLVDGKLVGSLPNGSFFTVNAEPGERNVRPDTGSFGQGAKVTVESGKAQCLKMTLNFCYGCKSADLDPVDNEQCENEIRPLTKVRLK